MGSNSLTASTPKDWREVSRRPERPTGGSSGIVGVGVDVDQEEFQLGRDDRLPAVLGIEVQDPLQHAPGSEENRAFIEVVGIADDLRRRFLVPGD